jgi:hypothetical protein
MAITKRVVERITTKLKLFQSVLVEAKNRDISESDTVRIIADLMADVLGYNKYSEITTEFAIRGTYVDLAVKVDDDIRFLVEAKAIGVALKDAHVKQAIDYAANKGIEWVILTNGIVWQIYKVHFRRPIEKSMVFELDLLQTSARDPELIECFGSLSREGFTHPAMTALYERQQVTSKFSLAAFLMGDAVITALRREMRRVFPGIKVDDDTLREALRDNVLKREVVESEEAKQAADYLKKAIRSAAKTKANAATASIPEVPVLAPESSIIVTPENPA